MVWFKRLQKEGKTNIQRNRMIGNVAKEDKLAKNLRAMSRDFSWFSKFLQCSSSQLSASQALTYSDGVNVYHQYYINAVFVMIIPTLILIIIIFIFVHWCSSGRAGEVMLWDKESIKLKFVSAATPRHSSTIAASQTCARELQNHLQIQLGPFVFKSRS